MTGQETPNTDKPLREDLYKKVMSGDPVAARLPYAINTKNGNFPRMEALRDERDHEVQRRFGSHVRVDYGRWLSFAREGSSAQLVSHGYLQVHKDTF